MASTHAERYLSTKERGEKREKKKKRKRIHQHKTNQSIVLHRITVQKHKADSKYFTNPFRRV